jgi:D-arabinose 1-dehydrogenase-like Zn-dependent alcohol dehydrogenase
MTGRAFVFTADYDYLQPGHDVLRAPEALDDLTIAPLNCALAQVIYGLEQASFRPGETVVVQGAGGLGLLATRWRASAAPRA